MDSLKPCERSEIIWITVCETDVSSTVRLKRFVLKDMRLHEGTVYECGDDNSEGYDMIRSF